MPFGTSRSLMPPKATAFRRALENGLEVELVIEEVQLDM